MLKTPTATTSQGAGQRHTIVLALQGATEALKSGVYDQARKVGWRVRDLSYFDMRIPQPCRADGVLFRLRPEDISLVRRFLRLDVPVVQIEDHVLSKRCCCVISDRRATGIAAAEHFAERGFRNMAYLHAEYYRRSKTRVVGDAFVRRARALGARAELIAVQHAGKTIPWIRFGELTKIFEKEIARFSLPLGIFTYHDGMAVRICQFCEALGLSVPEQVAVLGVGNDLNQCDFAPTRLSSIDPSQYEQGQVAAELLDRLMSGAPAPKKPIVIPPAGIVTRESTDVLAVPDVDTARALRFMWDHLAEPLSVDRVADAIGVSRRKLERHFRAHLGRSVTEELTRKRMERSCELLDETELPAKDIARQVGFRSEPYFFVVFRKAIGVTPRQYRLKYAAKAGNANTKP